MVAQVCHKVIDDQTDDRNDIIIIHYVSQVLFLFLFFLF